MENKTIKHLNTKAWYRLVKVIFILLFVIVLLIVNGIIFSENDFKQVVLGKTKITCTYGDKKTFTADEINLYSLSADEFLNGNFDYKTYFEGYGNEYDIRDIVNKCHPQDNSNFDVFAFQKVIEAVGDDVLKMEKEERPPEFISDANMEKIHKIEKAYGSEKLKYLDYTVKFFDISPVFSYIPFIKIFLLANVIIFAVFEIIRRVFYYVTLGSFRPKKG